MNVHSEKRDIIIEAAISAFGDFGYSSATIKDIAEHANIAPGSIYNYFQDKHELFVCAVDQSWQSFFRELDAAVSRKSGFLAQFEAVVDIGFDRLGLVHPLLRGMLSEANRQDMLAEHIDRVCARLDEMLVAGAAEGVVEIDPDPEQRKFFLKMMVSGVMFTASMTPPEQLAGEIEYLRERAKKRLFHRVAPAGRTSLSVEAGEARA
jgi:TetR/AcrR family transcriptional repressor of mexJK operon